MNNYKVYMHTTPSHKVYIGITKNSLTERWRNGLGYETQAFGRAIKKYGWENITHELVYDNLSESQAKEAEMRLIALYQSTNSQFGYNCTAGGDGCYSHIVTEEQKETMRISSKKMWQNEETRKKLLAHLKELNSSRVGTKMSAEFCRSVALGLGKKVSQYSMDGKLLKTYPTMMDASRSCGVKSNSLIVRCCKNVRKSAYGFIWQYGDEKELPKSVLDYCNSEYAYNYVPIGQYSLDGYLIKKYPSVRSACNENNLNYKAMSATINGKRKTYAGYIWKKEVMR